MIPSGSALRLLKEVVGQGYRIFTTRVAQKVADKHGIKSSYVPELLGQLKKEGWLRSIKQGLYAVTEESGFSSPHEYEIATALVSPSAISHWTAMYYHHLTQQIPRTVFVLCPTGVLVPRVSVRDIQFVRVKPDYYFGTSWVWMGDAKVSITDPERTLLDGLMMPQYCGGFEEVLHAFTMSSDIRI